MNQVKLLHDNGALIYQLGELVALEKFVIAYSPSTPSILVGADQKLTE
jgi:hypothetical protein